MTSRGFAEAKPVEGLDVERTLLSFQRPCRLGDGRKKAPDSRQRPSVLLAYYSMRAEGAPGVVGTGFPTATRSGGPGMIAGSLPLSNRCEAHEAALSGLDETAR